MQALERRWGLHSLHYHIIECRLGWFPPIDFLAELFVSWIESS
jgi:hypothetical protein